MIISYFLFRWFALLQIQICIILILYKYDCSLQDPLPKQVSVFRILNITVFNFGINSNTLVLTTTDKLLISLCRLNLNRCLTWNWTEKIPLNSLTSGSDLYVMEQQDQHQIAVFPPLTVLRRSPVNSPIFDIVSCAKLTWP